MEYPKMLSTYMSFEEATRSPTATRLGIDNYPDEHQLRRMEFVSNNVFDCIREEFGYPLTCSSFLRVPKLNKAVGSGPMSFHTFGAAIDLKKLTQNVTYKDIFEYIRECLMFSELIWEYGTDEEPDWVHVAYIEDDERKMVKRAVRENGRTKIIRLS